MPYQEKVKSAISNILCVFRSRDIPEALALAVHPDFDIPMCTWSLTNRLLAVLAGTVDARGYKQWKEVGRHVRKGTKSFTIFAPRFNKSKPENEDDEQGPILKLIGFVPVPVHRVEDTEGEPLDYERLKLPKLPLLEVAEHWGVKTTAVPGNKYDYGSYNSVSKEIRLASPEEIVFFHELAHAAHDRFENVMNVEKWRLEIIAELSSACLCRLVGKSPENLGCSYMYIADYAEINKLNPYQVCLKVLRDVEKVVNSILETSKFIQGQN